MIPIELLLELPWTIIRQDRQRGGEDLIELSVAELPGFMVYGSGVAEVEERFWSGLRLYLESYVSAGEVPPLPEGLEFVPAGRVPASEMAVRAEGDETVVTARKNSPRAADVTTTREMADVA